MNHFLRLIVAILLQLTLTLAAHAANVRVIDADDNSPLAGCSVFSSSGMIIGYTDNDGVIDIASSGSYPVTISCTGYVPAEISEPSTVALRHITYVLPEVNVNTEEHPVSRTLCYVRQYVTFSAGQDSTICYNEMMMDFFDAPRKTKGFSKPREPRILSSRYIIRDIDSKAGTDTIYSPDEREIWMQWDAFLDLPSNHPSKSGPAMEVKNGKYGIERLTERKGNQIRTRIDYLADEKNHVFSPGILKMLGMTLDITQIESTFVYDSSSSVEITSDNLVGGTTKFKSIGKGKIFKKVAGVDSPIEIYIVYDIYPLETEYLTVAEAKKIMKDKNLTVPIRQSKYTPPVPGFIRRMLKDMARWRV